MNKKFSQIFDTISNAGLVSGSTIRKIFSIIAMVLYGAATILIFGTVTFIHGMATGLKNNPQN